MLQLSMDIISPAEKVAEELLSSPLIPALIIGVVTAVVAGTVVLIVILRKKRRK